MADARDVVIIGGGHNGLVTAFYLAKAGRKPLVLERRPQVGGAAVTEEFHPGFRCSTLSHSAGPLLPQIIRDMQLQKHGLKLITPEISVASLSPDGLPLLLYNDARKSARSIATFSQNDAAKYAEFQETLHKLGKVLSKALALPPPNIDDPSRGDLWAMLETARGVRNLGKKDMYRCCAGGPWQWQTWRQNSSKTSCCGQPSRHGGFSARFWGRGRQAAASYSCCVRRGMIIQRGRHSLPKAGLVR